MSDAAIRKTQEGLEEKIQPVDLVKEMVLRLRNRILAGQYGDSGDLPPEAKLSQAFGVSRTVVREAMRTLRAQGLVEVSRGRRPRVKLMDPQSMTEGLEALLMRSNVTLGHLGQVRRSVEEEIAALAAEHASEADVRAMQQTIDDQLVASSHEKQVATDTRFHELLAKSTCNPVLPLILTVLSPLLEQSRHITISRVGPERAVEGHSAILQAVRNGNANAARQAMLMHLHMAEEDLEVDDGEAG